MYNTCCSSYDIKKSGKMLISGENGRLLCDMKMNGCTGCKAGRQKDTSRSCRRTAVVITLFTAYSSTGSTRHIANLQPTTTSY